MPISRLSIWRTKGKTLMLPRQDSSTRFIVRGDSCHVRILQMLVSHPPLYMKSPPLYMKSSPRLLIWEDGMFKW